MPEVAVPNDEAPESPKATFPSHLDKLGALAKKKWMCQVTCWKK